MILLFTGRGKGKTTAALGQAVRAIGQGKRVLMIEFIKGRSYPSGEDTAIKKFGPKFRLIKGGLGFVGIMGDSLPFSAHKKAAQKTLQRAKTLLGSGRYDLVILDEVNMALSLKLITKKQALGLVKTLPAQTDLILTGREAIRELIEKADLVTEMREVKHPFQKRARAKRGVEF